MTRLRTAAHEETELLTVLKIPFRVWGPLLTFSCLLGLSRPRALRSLSEDAPITKVSQGRVIPLLAGARVFPEAQPREWAPPANSSSEGLGNNSGFKRLGFECVPNCFRAPDAETENRSTFRLSE
jgi:hypothetical protein